MKKLLSILLSVILILTVCPIGVFELSAFAETASGTCGAGVTWKYDTSTATLTISGTGAMADYYYYLYDPYDTYVTTAPWRSYYSSMKTVVINSGVTSIGSYAFYGCYRLTSITIPDSVTSIGDFAFSGCTGLTSVTIPDSVTSIGEEAFSYCTGLTSVTIPDSVTSIGELAFFGCTGLTSVTIGNSVTSIGFYAFSGCNNLNYNTYKYGKCLGNNENPYLYLSKAEVSNFTGEFEFAPDVKIIGDYAFRDCYGLKSITIPDSVTEIGDSAFEGCTGLTSVTIPDSVTEIGSGAFSGCTGLTSVTIPDSVTSIGSGAFYGCTGLTSITIPDSVTLIGEDAISGCTALDSITVDNNSKVYRSENNCIIKKKGNILVAGCKNSVIPDSVTSISDGAFSGCTGLTSVTIPNSVTSIGYWAFSGCTGLTSVTIPDSVTSIGERAFSGCVGLSSITIPDSVTSIGFEAFWGCTGLKDVYYTGTEEQKDAIQIDNEWEGNNDLLNATWHYNYKPCKHNSTELKNQKAVSCTEDGYSGDTYCVDCGVKLTDGKIIPKTGHKYVWKITKLATDTESGLKEEICTYCGKKTGKSQELLYTGHITGDIGGDGAVNNKDITRLFKYLSGWETDVNKAALDVNGDGKVNNKDLTRLFQYLSGWAVDIF